MMDIVLNGEPASMPAGLSVSGLLEHMKLAGQRVAVEVNREIVPRSMHPDHRLKTGDHVEIVQAIGGG